MEEAMRRKLYPGEERHEEPEDQSTGLRNNLADQMADGYAGVRALQGSAWEAPADLKWDEADDWAVEPTVDSDSAEAARTRLKLLLASAAIFVLALLPRVYFLYFVTDPDVLIPSWSNDTWHRWQIAYLSSEVGIRQDPARLWDLKGLEYFWGMIHPLVSGMMFRLTGSVDVMILRWITLVAGALNIVLIYLLARRFWGVQVAAAAALLAIMNPIVIFNDPSGMVEPLSFAFLLAGIYFFPNRPWLAGLLWGLAALTRAEAWLMSGGLLIATIFSRQRWDRKIILGVGWAIPVLIYMKHLLDVTGNAIYPIYWNFLANAAGQWEFRAEYTDYQLAVRPVLSLVFLVALGTSVYVLVKQPRGYLFHLLGLGTTAFISGFIGLTSYLKSYEPWFWLTRFFVFPYLYLGLLAVLACMLWLPGRLKGRTRSVVGWAASILLIVGVQLTWPSVLHDVHPGYTSQTIARRQEEQGKSVANWYPGGTILIPEGIPQLTYALVRYGGISGANLLGQMYGPDHYFEGGDPVEHWDVVGPQMWDWFANNNVKMLVMDINDRRFLRMIEESPERFTYIGPVPYQALDIYWVDA